MDRFSLVHLAQMAGYTIKIRNADLGTADFILIRDNISVEIDYQEDVVEFFRQHAALMVELIDRLDPPI